LIKCTSCFVREIIFPIQKRFFYGDKSIPDSLKNKQARPHQVEVDKVAVDVTVFHELRNPRHLLGVASAQLRKKIGQLILLSKAKSSNRIVNAPPTPKNVPGYKTSEQNNFYPILDKCLT
jgi:hypothetical protein